MATYITFDGLEFSEDSPEQFLSDAERYGLAAVRQINNGKGCEVAAWRYAISAAHAANLYLKVQQCGS